MYSWLAVLSFAHLAFTGVQGQEYTDVTTPSGGSITIANYQQINTVRLAANIAGCKAACSDPDLSECIPHYYSWASISVLRYFIITRLHIHHLYSRRLLLFH